MQEPCCPALVKVALNVALRFALTRTTPLAPSSTVQGKLRTSTWAGPNELVVAHGVPWTVPLKLPVDKETASIAEPLPESVPATVTRPHSSSPPPAMNLKSVLRAAMGAPAGSAPAAVLSVSVAADAAAALIAPATIAPAR